MTTNTDPNWLTEIKGMDTGLLFRGRAVHPDFYLADWDLNSLSRHLDAIDAWINFEGHDP
jgi:hypothetical protein